MIPVIRQCYDNEQYPGFVTCAYNSHLPHAPFHFRGTVCKPSYFPTKDTAYETDNYWQSMRYMGQVLGVRMQNKGTIDEPSVDLHIYAAKNLSDPEIDQVVSELSYRFDLKANLNDFVKAFESDELLGSTLARWRGMRPSSNAGLYEYLVITTVLQNATVRRTVQMHDNLTQQFGSMIEFGGKCLSAYWAPEAIAAASEEALRALKVGYRAKGLKRQAEFFVHGGLNENTLRGLSNVELKQALLSIYGIGPASVWYLMFGVFKRYDAFEYISPWEQKIFSRLLYNREMVDAKEILAYADQRWGQWKMLAAHYLFEDLFWQRKNQPVPWLEELIQL